MIPRKKNKELKIISIMFILVLIVFFWGQIEGVKLFKSEQGTSWKASGPHPRIHHK